MTTLLRLLRSQVGKSLTFFGSKDVKVYDAARRAVSSTPKKHDTAADLPHAVNNTWVSYGFSQESEYLDRHFMHQSFFFGISVLLVGGTFLMAYMPDPTLRDWAQREAYLQLRHREENGLPLIDPNIIDPSKFTLPSEDEIKGVELII
ncbi:NADH dehydrogenase [ubiquinone] 1 beta subcomplex subunit NP15.6 [Andrena cerasifolii]|uniref:NADH dehydrogenase [ubiquinone] 1 beta subcomplex subunit NP15.6 n=1 Tax=Andrena cerasifolii TaxID=2819439 RepID=UPI004037E2A3